MSEKPIIEALESRTLLSVAAMAAAHPPALNHHQTARKLVVLHLPSHRLRLHGALAGSYTTPALNADVGREYDFIGIGTVVPLGAASMSGKVSTPGFIRAGFATGQLTLTGAHGSVTLSLKGPLEPGFGPVPERLAFTITGGAGDYAQARGAGHVAIQLNATAKTFTMKLTN